MTEPGIYCGIVPLRGRTRHVAISKRCNKANTTPVAQEFANFEAALDGEKVSEICDAASAPTPGAKISACHGVGDAGANRMPFCIITIDLT